MLWRPVRSCRPGLEPGASHARFRRDCDPNKLGRFCSFMHYLLTTHSTTHSRPPSASPSDHCHPLLRARGIVSLALLEHFPHDEEAPLTTWARTALAAASHPSHRECKHRIGVGYLASPGTHAEYGYGSRYLFTDTNTDTSTGAFVLASLILNCPLDR